METDARHEIQAIHRSVGFREREGRLATALVAQRTFSVRPEELWAALTDPERLAAWFSPVEGELRLGGRYRIEGNASGEITACEPGRRFTLTWEWGGGPPSWVEVRLDPAADGTRLTLEHTAHIPDEWWARYGPGAGGVGWDLSFAGLAEHLRPADPERRPIAQDRGFVEGSSEAWCRASIEAGTSPDAARAAADRTTAFYLGEAPPA